LTRTEKKTKKQHMTPKRKRSVSFHIRSLEKEIPPARWGGTCAKRIHALAQQGGAALGRHTGAVTKKKRSTYIKIGGGGLAGGAIELRKKLVRRRKDGGGED